MADPRDELVTILVGGVASIDSSLGWFAHTVYVENYTNQYVSLPDIVAFIPPYTARLLALPGVQKAKMLFGAPPGTTQVASIAGQMCNATWSERSVPVTGGPIGPIGVTANYYDRNGLSVTKSFSGTLAPHGNTTRWTYTVPAARKAVLEAIEVFQEIITAATAAAGLPLPSVATAVSCFPAGGGPASSIITAQFSTWNNVGGIAAVDLSSAMFLEPGDIITGNTTNRNTGGTIFHSITGKITEFDA